MAGLNTINYITDEYDPNTTHSTISFTVSTLVRPRNPTQADQIRLRLERTIDLLRTDPESRREVFGSNTKYLLVRRGPSEIGAARTGGRIHIHFTVNGEHYGPWDRAGIIAKRIQRWILRQWPELKNVYVHFQMTTDGRDLNYAKKQARVAAIEYSIGLTPGLLTYQDRLQRLRGLGLLTL